MRQYASDQALLFALGLNTYRLLLYPRMHYWQSSGKICQYQLHASRHMAIHKRNSILIVAQRPHQIQSACVLPLREPRKEARRLQWGEHKAGGAHVVP